MKKIIASLLITGMLSTITVRAQHNDIGADDEFYELLKQMGPELSLSEIVNSERMLEHLDSKIDDQLAYKYLWQKNSFVKPEETFCYPIGYVLNKETNVAFIFFYKGPADNIAFFVEIQTYNYKKGKLIDQLGLAAGFNRESSACLMQVINYNLVRFKTITVVGNTTIDLVINKKGVIDRD